MNPVQEVDVVYFYEHAARELDVACVITAMLEHEYSLSVEIIHWPSGFSRVENHLQPRLVVLPYCYAEENYTFMLAKWRRAMFFNAAWEQLFYPGNILSKTPHGHFAMEHVIHHSWSTHYSTYLGEQGLPGGRIFFNGQPAYTLYDEPYRNYFISRLGLSTRHGLNPACRWILFPENYNWAFYSDAKLSYFIDQGQSPQDVFAMRDFCKRSLAETMEWCARLARNENFEVIVRPRPSTSMNEFLHAAKEILSVVPSQMHFIQDGSVREWILASDIVISSYSTSLIEAAVAGKSTYMLEPYPIPGALRVEWHDHLPHIATYDEFLVRCTTVTGLDSTLGQWARKTLMSNGDSIHRIADFIAQLLCGRLVSPSLLSWKTIVPDLSYRQYIRLRKLYRGARYVLGIPKIEPVTPEYLKDVQRTEMIKDKIENWKDLLYASPQE
ncbi:MAG: hypothetical protein U0V48_11460 [Anaerolineales bacterium]